MSNKVNIEPLVKDLMEMSNKLRQEIEELEKQWLTTDVGTQANLTLQNNIRYTSGIYSAYKNIISMIGDLKPDKS